MVQAPLHSSLVSIGETVRNGVVFDLKNWRRTTIGFPMTGTDDLLKTVTDLFALLEERKVDYGLVGGVAMLQYIEGRNTQDIDLILAVPSLRKLPELVIREQDSDFAYAYFHDLRVDLLLTRNKLFDFVRKHHAAPLPFVEQTISTVTVEGLLLLKLYTLPSLYRQGNFARVSIYEGDIAALLQTYQPPVAPLLDVLAKHIGDADLVAVRGIVADIEARIRRFQNAQANFARS